MYTTLYTYIIRYMALYRSILDRRVYNCEFLLRKYKHFFLPQKSIRTCGAKFFNKI